MKQVATLLVWLALLFGLPQALICGVMIFSSGWAIPLVLIFLLSPFVPLILMQEIRRWQRLPPAATASAALMSIAVSAGFYWMLYYRMR
ncbi:hypothetical protein V1277_003285 [Bradyrhizobium sp. AZCC 1588]|uniref:hypothetical protein n=1 Tax=unclassified Bradyrhizobium TaxID=2631580 RepID=UPI002FF383B4